VGISPHQRELCAVLDALAPGCARAVRDLYADFGDGARAATTRALLLLDGDHVSVEDIGWIRRLLATGRLSTVVVMGTDPSDGVVRRLRQSPAVSWAPWPPDLDELRRLASPSAFAPAAPTPAAEASRATELSSAPGETATDGRPLEDVTLTPFVPAAPPLPHSVSLTVGRDQVAVLADITQRLELAFLALRESKHVPEADLESPQIELRRLLRFTRSLACLAAPPPRGADEFDVAAVIEELLATLTLRGRRGPRFQPGAASGGKAGVEFLVRADRAALTLAIETVLAVARLCSSTGDTVRVAYTPLDTSAVAIQFEFPSGPLSGVAPEQLLDVALLRERLPELDPNELAAAGAIVRSEGGEMEFATASEGRLAVVLRLPIERRATPARAPRTGVKPQARVDDPFA